MKVLMLFSKCILLWSLKYLLSPDILCKWICTSSRMRLEGGIKSRTTSNGENETWDFSAAKCLMIAHVAMNALTFGFLWRRTKCRLRAERKEWIQSNMVTITRSLLLCVQCEGFASKFGRMTERGTWLLELKAWEDTCRKSCRGQSFLQFIGQLAFVHAVQCPL